MANGVYGTETPCMALHLGGRLGHCRPRSYSAPRQAEIFAASDRRLVTGDNRQDQQDEDPSDQLSMRWQKRHISWQSNMSLHQRPLAPEPQFWRMEILSHRGKGKRPRQQRRTSTTGIVGASVQSQPLGAWLGVSSEYRVE